MKQEKRERRWVLDKHTAKVLADIATCHPHTIQSAAKGNRCAGDSGRRAQSVVADHFDLNPTKRPSGWTRPAHAPLRYQVASRIATEAGVVINRVQEIASGIPAYDEVGAKITALLSAHYEQHPEDKPQAAGAS